MWRLEEKSSPTCCVHAVPQSLVSAVMLIVAACCCGCGTHDGKLSLSGTVTVDAAPLAEGSISFEPADGARGNTAGAIVRDGAFKIDAAAGLNPGKYVATIRGERQTGRMWNDPQRGKVPELAAIRFERYDREVTVSDGAENVFTFSLKSVTGQ